MFQDIMDKLQIFPLVYNFDICGFDTYGTLVARINRIYRGLPVTGKFATKQSSMSIHIIKNYAHARGTMGTIIF
jgi:hypothetical protein